MESGIYNIRNLINNKIYIGSSINLKKRFSTHKLFLRNNKHHSSKLQNSYNKYKAENFIYEIIEYCEASKLIEREQIWIDFFKPEYNILKKSSSSLGYKHTNESKDKIRISQMGKVRSKESKLKNSLCRLGIPKTEEAKIKQSITRTGVLRGRYKK